MKAYKEKNLTERMQTSAQAKQALLEKFKARPGPDDPAVKARQAERQAISAAREKRAREREAQRLRDEQELAARKEREEAEKAAAKERELQEFIELEAQQKALRDAKYAARKKRKK